MKCADGFAFIRGGDNATVKRITCDTLAKPIATKCKLCMASSLPAHLPFAPPLATTSLWSCK